MVVLPVGDEDGSESPRSPYRHPIAFVSSCSGAAGDGPADRAPIRQHLNRGSPRTGRSGADADPSGSAVVGSEAERRGPLHRLGRWLEGCLSGTRR